MQRTHVFTLTPELKLYKRGDRLGCIALPLTPVATANHADDILRRAIVIGTAGVSLLFWSGSEPETYLGTVYPVLSPIGGGSNPMLQVIEQKGIALGLFGNPECWLMVETAQLRGKGSIIVKLSIEGAA